MEKSSRKFLLKDVYRSEYNDDFNKLVDLIEYYNGEREFVYSDEKGISMKIGNTKPEAKEILDKLLNLYNEYCICIYDDEYNTSHHGSPVWEKTGCCWAKAKYLPNSLINSLNKLILKNKKEDLETYHTLIREKEVSKNDFLKNALDELDKYL